MTPSLTFTVHPSPLAVRYLLTVLRYQWIMANGQRLVRGKWLTANGATGGCV